MVFSSIPFLFYFLPVLLAAYYVVPASQLKIRNIVLLVFSLIFYAWGQGEYFILLLLLCAMNLGLGQFLTGKQSRPLLFAGIGINLVPLMWYKYSGFVATNLGFSSWEAPLLLLGISFFTFQSISYLVDVYRGQCTPSKDFVHVALYICAFPQLIAGPIVRYHFIAEQIENREHSYDRFSEGVRWFVVGLSQKLLIADQLGPVADLAFSQSPELLSTTTAWLGLACYTLQIYFDFSGYSSMAIGLGAFFGFIYPRNFNFPYIALSVRAFWQRWHMTLSNWFRDYVYIPLGGNRAAPLSTYFNLVVVFILCGLWHGAQWTFLIWGLWHGAFLVLERGGFGRFLEKQFLMVRSAYTLLAIMLGWVWFRADSFSHGVGYLKALFGLNKDPAFNNIAFFIGGNGLVLLILAGLLSTPFFVKIDHAIPIKLKSYKELCYGVGLGLLFMLCVLSLSANTYNPFLYFRF